ncbi:MAG: hypothetical protein KGL39_34270 [Patescibacteria group bacterium]|nr:hypothetical protein [Patescibacteria group bacterium]
MAGIRKTIYLGATDHQSLCVLREILQISNDTKILMRGLQLLYRTEMERQLKALPLPPARPTLRRLAQFETPAPRQPDEEQAS